MQTVIPLSPTQRLQSIEREKRTRNYVAYIFHDIKTGTLILTQKLQHAADFANTHLAQAQREFITLQSIYEAIDTNGNRVEGCHKMRYRITRCDLYAAHAEFELARRQPGIRTAVVLTASPSCYHIVSTVDSYHED